MYDTSVLYMEHGWMNPDYYKFSKQYFTKGAGKQESSRDMTNALREIKALIHAIDIFIDATPEENLDSYKHIPDYPDTSLKYGMLYTIYYGKLGECRRNLTSAYGDIYEKSIRLKRNEYKSQNQKALNHGGIYTDNHDCLGRRQHRNRSFHLHGVRL